MLTAFGRLHKEDKIDSVSELTRRIPCGTSISLDIGDIGQEIDGVIQQCGGVPRTEHRYTAHFHLNRNMEMARGIYDKIMKELHGQETTRRWLEGRLYHLQQYVREKESCRTQVTEVDEQKTLTLDFIKSLVEPAHILIWMDYSDNFDNHCGLIQKCLDSKSREYLWEKADEWYSDAEWEAIREIITKPKEECAVFHDLNGGAVNDFFDEYEDEVRDETYNRNDSDMMEELIRHTDDIPIRVEMLFDYDYINSNRFESQGSYRYEESYSGDMVNSLNLNPARVKKTLVEHSYKAYGRFPSRKNRNGEEQVSYEQSYEELIDSRCGANLLIYIGRVGLRELYEADFSLKEATTPEDNCCGLFSSTHGDGSPLETELKRSVELKLEVEDYHDFRFRPDDERSKYDCSARHVYGVDDSFFGDTVRIIS